MIAYMQNVEKRKVNLILEFCINVTVSFYYIGSFGVYITEDSFGYLVLARLGLVPNGGVGTAGELIEKTGLYLPVFYGIFAVCLVAFLMINFPKFMPKTEEKKRLAQEENKFDHGMVYLRLLMILVFILANIYVSYIG